MTLLRAPRAVLCLLFVISIAAAAALFDFEARTIRIELDPSSQPLIPSDDPGSEGYRRAVLDFGDDEVFVIAMQTDGIFSTEHLTTLRVLTRRLIQIRGVRSAESLVNVTVIRNDARNDMLEVTRLIHEIPSAAAELQELRARALADPLLTRSIVSTDGKTAALNIRFMPWSDLELIRAGVIAQIEEIIAQEARPNQRFYVAGRPFMKARAHQMMLSDLARLIPLAILVMSLVLWIVTGSFRGVLIPMGTVLIATLWTFGLIAHLGYDLNLLTIVLGPILIAVGSVYGVHILAHYEQIAKTAANSHDAATQLIASTRAPVLMAGASTAIGFVALLLTDFPAARELGMFAAFGTIAVTSISLTGLPAMVAVLPLRKQTDSPRAHAIGQRLDFWLESLAGWIGRHAKLVVAIWLGTALLALSVIPRIVVDTDYLTFFGAESKLRRDFAAINRLLAGAVPIYVVLTGEQNRAFNEPENLRTLERLQQRFDRIPGVSHSLSLADLVRVVHKAVRDGDPAYARIPDTQSEIAQLMLVIPKSKSKPLINVDRRRSNIPLRTGEQGSAAVRALVADIEEAIAAELPAELDAEITGDSILLNRSADRLARNQARTVGITAIAIFSIVALAFRSLPLAAIAMLPNIVPLLFFYGLLGLGLAPLSLPTSMIGSIVLGIAVDDTVHFLTRYRNRVREGKSSREAIIDCGRQVGRPIAITSLMLFFGFLVIALSSFATLQQFGLLIGLTIVICLSTDLILLPAALVLVEPQLGRSPSSPSSPLRHQRTL